MKKKILSGIFLLVIVALISIGRTPPATGQANTGKVCDDRLIAVMNPAISNKMAERVPLAPRLDTLEGKTIYLVDMQWGGPEAGYSVFEEMQSSVFPEHAVSQDSDKKNEQRSVRRRSGTPEGDR